MFDKPRVYVASKQLLDLLLSTRKDTFHGWNGGLGSGLNIGFYTLARGIGYIDLPWCFYRCVACLDVGEK